MTIKESKIWDEVNKELDQKVKSRLVLAAFVESDEEFIRELRDDAKRVIRCKGLTDEQKKESVEIIIETIKVIRETINKTNYTIAGK